MATVTRKTLDTFMNSIKDAEICILPADILSTLVKNNVDQQERSIAIQQRIATSLESLATNLQAVEQPLQEGGEFQNLITKIDLLTTAMTNNNVAASQQAKPTDSDVETLTNKIRDCEWKILRSTDLSKYNGELLDVEPPYVRRKYRAKIGPSTPDFEKPIKEDEAKHNVRSDIRLMEARVAQWSGELDDMKAELEEKKRLLSNSKREEISKKVRDNTEAMKTAWGKAFEKIKKQVEDERNSSATQFLLKGDKDDEIIESDDESPSKNLLDQGPRSRNRKDNYRGTRRQGRGQYRGNQRGQQRPWNHQGNRGDQQDQRDQRTQRFQPNQWDQPNQRAQWEDWE